MGSVVDKIVIETKSRLEAIGNPEVKTIFIGGGTPSSLPISILSNLLAGIKPFIDSSEEVTIEANPESVTPQFLETLEEFGVTRLSIGVQSFNDSLLKVLGRDCSSSQAIKAIELIKEKWYGEYSIDLISSIPTQTIKDVREDIQLALNYNPDHISFYSLILEEGTELEDRVSKGDVEELEEELEESIWLFTRDKLTQGGYINYEVSNFYKTKPSLHNLNYWELKPYLGVGPGGVSTLIDNGKIIRVENPKSINLYLRNSGYGATYDEIEPGEFLKEYIMMGLRLRSGIDQERFKKIFGDYLDNILPNFSDLKSRGLIDRKLNSIMLTPKGYDLMNSVISEIFDSLEDVKTEGIRWFY